MSRLQIIGEAYRKLSAPFRERHPEIPWRRIIGTRNHLVHAYFDVDADAVWTAIADEVPVLKSQIEAALASAPAEPNSGSAK